MTNGPLVGWLYDTQGNAIGFLMRAVLTLLGAFCFQKAPPPHGTDTVSPQAATE